MSEEGSEVSSEGAGLHWVAGIRLVPMYCGVGGGEREGEGEEEAVREPCYYDLDHILQELEVCHTPTVLYLECVTINST